MLYFLEEIMAGKLWRSLSAFERGLWTVSVIVVSVSFAVSWLLTGQFDILTLIDSLIGVTALIFVAKGQVIGQVLTVVFAVFYGIISYYFAYYGEMITYLCMTAPIAAASVVSWIKHPYDDGSEVAVGKLSALNKMILTVSAAAVTVLFYFILGALGNANLLISTVSITTSYVASYLTLFRSPFYAVAYSLNDIVLIVLWTLASMTNIAYVPMIFCFIAFLANDLYGFVNWRRMKKRQIS